MERVRLGLVGLGEWPRQSYVPILKGLDGVEVTAVAARSEATRQYAREQFGEGVTLFADYRELLQDARIDAVTFALPNAIHAEILEEAVGSGKHVFYEPPIAHSPAAISRILVAMRASGRVMWPDLELRHVPAVRALGECLRTGVVGDPLMASVTLWCNWGFGGGKWNGSPEEEGFFPWLGCWYLDLLDYVFTAAPERATVTGGYAANGRLADHGWVSLHYPAGRIGRFEFNLVAVEGLDVRLNVLGAAGEVEVDVIGGGLRWRGADKVWHETTHPASQPVCGFVGMRECLGAFVDAVRSGRTSEAEIEVAGRVHAAMLACAESEATRATIDVPCWD